MLDDLGVIFSKKFFLSEFWVLFLKVHEHLKCHKCEHVNIKTGLQIRAMDHESYNKDDITFLLDKNMVAMFLLFIFLWKKVNRINRMSSQKMLHS